MIEHSKMAIDSNTDNLTIKTNDSATEAQLETNTAPDKKKTLTKTQKNNRRLIKLLEERYPKTFNWHNPKPLKIGIDKEIQLDETLTQGKLKRALAAYTRSTRYKKCLENNTARIDLDGKRVKDQTTHKKKPIPNKKDTAANKKTNRTTEKQDDQKLAGYSQEERLKIKLEQLITANKAK